jgi:hypothetical protein
MRLLNTTTLEFEEFVGRPAEEYAILSHRWGHEEVSFKEYRKSRETLKHRAGYKKITQFCRISKQRGYRLAWIDTCCIDKRSSAELSEAINSMYEWYARSGECYVWLEDYRGNLHDLHKCAWFSRGWTLQEMLAPDRVIFFTAHWEVIGHKLRDDLSSLLYGEFCPCQRNPTPSELALLGLHITPWLAKASRIPEIYLTTVKVEEASIAARFSWASHRSTTRTEDRAYSLMGLFGINMPLLYGEGDDAFRRLQEEILRQSDDTSIFCHSNNDFLYKPSILARDPGCFSTSGNVTQGRLRSSEPYSLTNRGLRMRAHASVVLIKGLTFSNNRICRIDLGCTLRVSDLATSAALPPQVSKRPDPPEPCHVQYLYLICDDDDRYTRSIFTSDEIHRAMSMTKTAWRHIGEKVFFID